MQDLLLPIPSAAKATRNHRDLRWCSFYVLKYWIHTRIIHVHPMLPPLAVAVGRGSQGAFVATWASLEVDVAQAAADHARVAHLHREDVQGFEDARGVFIAVQVLGC